MRTTIVLDDELLGKAKAYSGFQEKSAVVREALKMYVHISASRRLALLRASQPDLRMFPGGVLGMTNSRDPGGYIRLDRSYAVRRRHILAAPQRWNDIDASFRSG